MTVMVEATPIRRATAADVDAIVAMGQTFIETTAYREFLKINHGQMRKLVEWLLDQGIVCVAEVEGTPIGMIGIVVLPHMISGEPIAQEVFWFVEKPFRHGVGRELLKEAATWAKRAGATKIQMIAPTPRVEKLYERMGFKRVEVSYQRSL